jgi:ATP/maltotriose-dependent transcriptional regulator MalT
MGDELHMRHLYAKLGVHRRHEAARCNARAFGVTHRHRTPEI